MSDLPRLEIDARIDHGVGEVGDQIYDKTEKRENVEVAEDHRIVAVHQRIVREIAEAVEREDLLDEQGAGKESADERAGEAGDDDQHRIAEDMAVEHLALG